MDQNRNSNSMLPRLDQVTIQRKLIIFLGLILTVVVAAYTLRTGNRLFMIGLVALPFLLMLMHRPDITFVMALVLDASRIPLPGVSYTTVGLVMKVLLIGTAVMAVMLGQSRNKKMTLPEDKPLKWFVAVVLMLMAVRGTGLRMLGSSTWGGMVYIVILLGIAFFFAVQGLTISKKQIRWIVIGSAIAGLLGSIVSYQGWSEKLALSSSEIVKSRLSWLYSFVVAVFPLVFVIKLPRLISVFLWFSMLIVVALTGYRSNFVELIVITGIYGFFRARRKMAYMIGCILFGLFAWGAIVAVSPALPLSMQRTVSFVPGVGESDAKADAEGSVEWRVEIWRYCLAQSKQYLLIGRGSAFDVYETSGNLSRRDIIQYTPWYAYATRSYHSGPLTLLIDYGAPGLLVALWLTGVVMRRLWCEGKMLSNTKTFEGRYGLYLLSYLLWEWFAFFAVMGGAPNWGLMISSTAGAVVIINSLKKEREDEGGLFSYESIETKEAAV